MLRIATLVSCALVLGCATSEPRPPAAQAPTPASAATGNTPAGPAAAPPRGAEPPRAPVVQVVREISFVGMCDASGAVPLDDHLFAVADDEDNVLRVYDADLGGEPLAYADVSARLGLPTKAKKPKKPKKHPPKHGKKSPKSPETDIEGATRIGSLAYWITSHGRNSAGEIKTERHRMFATTLPGEESELELTVSGVAYDGLLRDLAADARFARFELGRASELAPKEPGGLNIEGMTERTEGGVWIGFRNPVPEGRALVFALLNPEEIVQGGAARFGDPLTLDLGGLGVRGMSSWHGRYLVAAGHHSSGAQSRLFSWDGAQALQALDFPALGSLNPEGFFTPETRDEFMLLSDDGTMLVGDVECKRQKDTALKRFRAVWVRVESPASVPQ